MKPLLYCKKLLMSRPWRDNIMKVQEELTGFLGAKVTFMCELQTQMALGAATTASASVALKFYYQNLFQCNSKWSHPSNVKPLITNKSG